MRCPNRVVVGEKGEIQLQKAFCIEQRAWAGSVQLEDLGEVKLCGYLFPPVYNKDNLRELWLHPEA